MALTDTALRALKPRGARLLPAASMLTRLRVRHATTGPAWFTDVTRYSLKVSFLAFQ